VVQGIINATLTVFGRHRSGALFPIMLSVKAMGSSFVGIVQKLATIDQYVVLPNSHGCLQ
jgi:hypothetical protein